jgi:hypothetical protein
MKPDGKLITLRRNNTIGGRMIDSPPQQEMIA